MIAAASFGMISYLTGNVVFVSTVMATSEMEFTGISVPSMEETVRFRLSGLALDLRPAGSVLHFTNSTAGQRTEITELELARVRGEAARRQQEDASA